VGTEWAVSPDANSCGNSCSQWANSSTDTPTDCQTWKGDSASDLGSDSGDSSGAIENWGTKDWYDALNIVNVGETSWHYDKVIGQKVTAVTSSEDAEQGDHDNGLEHLDTIN